MADYFPATSNIPGMKTPVASYPYLSAWIATESCPVTSQKPKQSTISELYY